ncbi:hypothetical protein Bbelb_037280 [Branchiostoma belcheri]|nr:hypothetical protein Bbelb_037280 [Branchiostoma belcheri]
MPVTLFVYGDFVQDFPDLITKWADRYTIGIREACRALSSRPLGPAEPGRDADEVVSAVQRMKEVGLRPAYYYPEAACHNGFKIQRRTEDCGSFSQQPRTLLKEDNYYRYRDVERTPKALRILYERISKEGSSVWTLIIPTAT